MKKQLTFAAAVVLTLGISGTAFATHNANHNPTPPKKYFVCKYVGNTEVLQTGNNPISVSESALTPPIVIGALFKDGQDNSRVVAEDTGQAEPTCPSTPVVVVDVCDNIPGAQATVPANHVLQGKICVEQDAGDYTDGKEDPVVTPTVEETPAVETQVFQGK